MRAFQLRILALLVTWWLPACSAPTSTPAEGEVDFPAAEVLLEDAGKLGGCAIGEADAAWPGPELAAAGSDGRIHVLHREQGAWIHEVVDRMPGEQIQLAAGPVGPDNVSAVVSVGVLEGGEDDGGAGVAWLVFRGRDGWSRRELLRDEALIHAVAIGDLDAGWPGNEVVVAGFSGRVTLIGLGTGEPVAQGIGHLPANAKGLTLGLGGVVVACDDGSLLRLIDTPAGWVSSVLAKHDYALARISGRDDGVVYCGNGGLLRTWNGNRSRDIYSSKDRLRGAVFVNTPDGLRLASAGYDRSVRLHALDRGAGQRFLFADTDRLHHLAAGEIDGSGALLACGYSGKLTLQRLVH